MEEQIWFEEYTGQSTDELLALEGKYRTDSIVVAFEQALYQKIDRVGYEKLSEEEKIILAIEALEREVNNGGYSQFFFNSSKEYAPILVNSLKRIGCENVALLSQEAIAILGITDNLTVEAIDAAMDAENEERDEKLSDCDSKYYSEAGDLSEPLLNFIKMNKTKIIIS